jgi:hypothetical protein
MPPRPVGEALAPFRGQVVIATKFGFDLDPKLTRGEPDHVPPSSHGDRGMQVGILGSGLMGSKLGTIFARAGEPFALLVAQLAYEGTGGPELAYRFERFAEQA